MAWLSIEVQCGTCDEVYGTLVDRDTRNESVPCEKCPDGQAIRIWSVPNVSTAKTSATIPDSVAKGRFSHLKDIHDLKKQAVRAKQKWARSPTEENRSEMNRLKQEQTKREKIK